VRVDGPIARGTAGGGRPPHGSGKPCRARARAADPAAPHRGARARRTKWDSGIWRARRRGHVRGGMTARAAGRQGSDAGPQAACQASPLLATRQQAASQVGWEGPEGGGPGQGGFWGCCVDKRLQLSMPGATRRCAAVPALRGWDTAVRTAAAFTARGTPRLSMKDGKPVTLHVLHCP
jgi:hypothetical protein